MHGKVQSASMLSEGRVSSERDLSIISGREKSKQIKLKISTHYNYFFFLFYTISLQLSSKSDGVKAWMSHVF